MAVVISKAAAISNRDGTPPVLNDPQIQGQFIRELVGTVETVSGDSVGSKYIFAQVPANCRISQLLLFADDVGTTLAADFGLYKTVPDGGVVVDADFFASAVAMNAAVTNALDITHESTVFDADDVEKKLWQALGLAKDPQCFYDVVATLTGAADAAGTISMKIRYVI